MIRSIALAPSMIRGPGVYQSPSIEIPAEATYVGCIAHRAGWSNPCVVTLSVEVSLDDQRWIRVVTVTASGGVTRDRHGLVSPETSALARIPDALRGQDILARVNVTTDCPLAGAVWVSHSTTPWPRRVPDEHHSVTYDTDLDGTAINATGLTISGLTIAANANRALVVGVATWDSVASNSLVSSVTWNGSGVGFAQITTELGPGASINRASLWGLVNPTATTADVVVTLGGESGDVGVCALSLYDVDPSVSFAGAISGEGTGTTSATVSTTVSGVGTSDMVVDAVYVSADTLSTPLTVGAGQIARQNGVIAAGISASAASTQLGTSGGIMTWDVTAVDTIEWVAVACVVKATSVRKFLLNRP